ncbi:MAG: ATP-binding protein [Anaerolineales bacterium]|nr:ATP-binding protein [Anaerolineales bacterium]
MNTDGKFFLGNIFDVDKKTLTNQALLYDPDDLTTHAMVVGMTGSGKTGLCIGMLEEAALNGIPSIMVDPKGDITNTLLHFPDLLPQDFQPWIDPDQARREGVSIEKAAETTAAQWKKGLAQWGIDSERITKLKNSAEFAIYTPGSDAGIPVSILSSLKAPEIPWESNKELLREKISGTVTALLGLVGLTDIDPVRSREHILLSNIFEHAWNQGKDLNLGELIMQVQTPPFQKLGVLEVNSFFPDKDRFSLAMLLNNILAAPAFQTWVEGQPLDIASLLYTPQGKPRHCVFYIAHLTDEERMFFVTLLFSAVEAWMRAQSGSGSLRAIVYFDEIFGYLPPLGNPPSKEIILRMLKQARAFGVGLVLVSQNPVDLDYKGLSNTGTWMVGKLQTDQDKQRLLDGLEGATSGSLNRSEYDKLISSLGKRVFLVHNVHEAKAQVFSTRWCMNYLAGPLTRAQIPGLNKLAGATGPAGTTVAAPQDSVKTQAGIQASQAPKPAKTTVEKVTEISKYSSTRPAIPTGVDVYFLPNNLTLSAAIKAAERSIPQNAENQGLVYYPVVLGQASIRFLNRKYDLDYDIRKTVLVPNPDRRGMVRWDDYPFHSIQLSKLDKKPVSQARFGSLEAPFTDAKIIKDMQKDFLDWAYRSSEVTLHANEELKVYAGPEVSSAQFRTQCAETARKERDAEIKKSNAAFDSKMKSLKNKLAKEERELESDKSELSQRKMEELGGAAETVFGLFTGKKSSRRISSSLSKRRMTSQAKADVEESLDVIEELKKQIADIEAEKAQAEEEIKNRWEDIASLDEEITVTPLKKDVLLDMFGVAWMPYHLVKTGDESIELPGYGSQLPG